MLLQQYMYGYVQTIQKAQYYINHLAQPAQRAGATASTIYIQVHRKI